MSEIIAAARVVTSASVLTPGWVETSGDRVVALGAGAPPRTPSRDLGAATLVPGFVDMHVHGGGGASYTDASRTAVTSSRDAHLARGTTRTMASLVTADSGALLAQVSALAGFVAEGLVAGIHLEGPWLSPERAGAHDPELLRHPDLTEIDALLAAGAGAIAMVTIAPELPGAVAAIERFVAAGVVVAIGHTAADYGTARRAIDAGATVATHLFNAMPSLHHREPGPVLALLEDPRVTLELIADGTHLRPELARWVMEKAGPDRVALVTDAMAAAGCGDGHYALGTLDVEVTGGVARLEGSDTIAGSTVTMDALFRWCAAGTGADTGQGTHGRERAESSDAALCGAVRATATNPARALGWSDVGDIAVGKTADFVVLDPELRVARVIRSGEFAQECISTPRDSGELR